MSEQAILSKKFLEVNGLHIHFPTDMGMLKAVNGIDFIVERGKTLGIVGESGCGKSVTSKALIGLNPKEFQTTGEIFLYDEEENKTNLLDYHPTSKQMRMIRGKKISMIFQEPMTAFSPLYTIGNQIMEVILLHQTKNKKEAKQLAINMLEKVGISNAEGRFHQYPHEFSGGMRQRAMIAMALSCNPELLIADEPTTALDVTIQAQVLELMKKLQADFKMSILFITHDLGIVAEMCDDVAVMYLGQIVEKAPVRDIFKNPKHPYTKGLLHSIPTLGQKNERLASIEGTVPLAINMPEMCGFYDRCSERIEGVCNQAYPAPISMTENHSVRCFLYDGKTEGRDGNG
ncbi:ABC transporter ATP-binding protein [Alkalihalobacterium bogoriense]|uniref:ABC transporter ATP-binding protein n=1 Tax=Alkalihalobacterium bogoriense TaxID=246272 RepID=UPI00047C7472|nr:ABC transporter ATP-binding protein [Alkalihalobacterium bogoriense]